MTRRRKKEMFTEKETEKEKKFMRDRDRILEKKWKKRQNEPRAECSSQLLLLFYHEVIKSLQQIKIDQIIVVTSNEIDSKTGRERRACFYYLMKEADAIFSGSSRLTLEKRDDEFCRVGGTRRLHR